MHADSTKSVLRGYPDCMNTFALVCGTEWKRSGSNYSNLLSHVQSLHADAFRQMQEGTKLSQFQLEEYFNTVKSGNLYGWLNFIINGLPQFTFFEKPIIRKHLRHDAPSLNTFMKYMSDLSQIVEHKISKLLPSKFALVIEG